MWSGLLCDDTKYYFLKKYKIYIVNRVEGADSFGAGIIYGLLSKRSPRDVIVFNVAAYCL